MNLRRLMLSSLSLLLLTLSASAEIASWYGAECAGKPMANGKPFNPNALTCASWKYPLGTRLKVCHKNCTVFVTVTDRGPAKRLGRDIDLSRAAFKQLCPLEVGLAEVEIYEK